MRYHKTFKSGIVTLLLCCALFGAILTMSIIERIEYNEITQGMLTTDAAITEIKIDRHSTKYGGYDQEMQIVYVVDGKTYNRELATDTPMASEAGYIVENQESLCHMHMHDALGKKNHLALGTGELELDKYLSLAEDQKCRVVLETKTIEGLKQSVNWMRQKGRIK